MRISQQPLQSDFVTLCPAKTKTQEKFCKNHTLAALEPWMDFFHTNDFKRLHKQVCHVCQILITIGRDTLIHPQMACSQDSPKIYRLQEDDLAQRKAVFQHR